MTEEKLAHNQIPIPPKPAREAAPSWKPAVPVVVAPSGKSSSAVENESEMQVETPERLALEREKHNFIIKRFAVKFSALVSLAGVFGASAAAIFNSTAFVVGLLSTYGIFGLFALLALAGMKPHDILRLWGASKPFVGYVTTNEEDNA